MMEDFRDNMQIGDKSGDMEDMYGENAILGWPLEFLPGFPVAVGCLALVDYWPGINNVALGYNETE